MNYTTTTNVNVKIGTETIFFPWQHSARWGDVEKLRCCLMRYTTFAQTMPNSPAPEIAASLLSLLKTLLYTYKLAKVEEKSKSELQKIDRVRQSEENIITIFLGFAVVITGYNGLEGNEISVNVETIQKMITDIEKVAA